MDISPVDSTRLRILGAYIYDTRPKPGGGTENWLLEDPGIENLLKNGRDTIAVKIGQEFHPIPSRADLLALNQVMRPEVNIPEAPLPAIHLSQLLGAGLSLSGLAAYPAYLSLAAGKAVGLSVSGHPVARLQGQESPEDVQQVKERAARLGQALDQQSQDAGPALLASYDTYRNLQRNPQEEMLQPGRGLEPATLAAAQEFFELTAGLQPAEQRHWLALVATPQPRLTLKERMDSVFSSSQDKSQAQSALHKKVEERRAAHLAKVEDCLKSACELGLTIDQHLARRQEAWKLDQSEDSQIEAELALIKQVGFQSPSHLATLQALSETRLSLEAQAMVVNTLVTPEQLSGFRATGALDEWPRKSWIAPLSSPGPNVGCALNLLDAYKTFQNKGQQGAEVASDLRQAFGLLQKHFKPEEVSRRLQECKNCEDSRGFLQLAKMLCAHPETEIKSQVELEQSLRTGPVALSYAERAEAFDGLGLLESSVEPTLGRSLWSAFAKEVDQGLSSSEAVQRIQSLVTSLEFADPQVAANAVEVYNQQLVGQAVHVQDFYLDCLRQKSEPAGAAALALSLAKTPQHRELANGYRKLMVRYQNRPATLDCALGISTLVEKGQTPQAAFQAVATLQEALQRDGQENEPAFKQELKNSLDLLSSASDLSAFGQPLLQATRGLKASQSVQVGKILSQCNSQEVAYEDRLQGFADLLELNRGKNRRNQLDPSALAGCLTAELKTGDSRSKVFHRLQRVLASTALMADSKTATRTMERYQHWVGRLKPEELDLLVASPALPWTLSLLGSQGNLVELSQHARQLGLDQPESVAHHPDVSVALAEGYARLIGSGRSSEDALAMLGAIVKSFQQKATPPEAAAAGVQEALNLAIAAPAPMGVKVIHGEHDVMVGGIRIKKKRPQS